MTNVVCLMQRKTVKYLPQWEVEFVEPKYKYHNLLNQCKWDGWLFHCIGWLFHCIFANVPNFLLPLPRILDQHVWCTFKSVLKSWSVQYETKQLNTVFNQACLWNYFSDVKYPSHKKLSISGKVFYNFKEV